MYDQKGGIQKKLENPDVVICTTIPHDVRKEMRTKGISLKHALMVGYMKITGENQLSPRFESLEKENSELRRRIEKLSLLYADVVKRVEE